MKSKKAFFGIFGVIYLVLIIIMLILLIWFGVKISAGLVAIFSFLKTWWWAVALTIFWISPPGRAIMKSILGRLGIKV